MSNFGRDLVGNVNCGTANPLMQMVGQMQGMGAQVADVRSFGVTDKGVGGMNVRPEMVRSHTTPMQPESSHFMQAFHQQGPTVNNAIPLHIQQQQRQMQQMQQRMIPQQAGPQAHAPMAAGPDLADQFMQMELQSKEFERAFQQSLPPQQQQPVGGGPDMWAQEFHTRQQAMHQAQQHHQQKMMRAPAPWMQGGMMMGGRPMMGMGMGMMGMGMGMGMGGMSMGMPYMNAQPMQAASSSSSTSATVEEVTDEATTVGDQEQEDQPYDYLDGIVNSSSIDEAYKIANQEAEFANAPQQGGLGGGMDQEMLNKLMNSDNPKWRNSKFLAFINKISKGEIEFRDNQAFERPAGSAQPSHQDMYGDASSSSNVGADWADEFSVNQNHPASWSDQFANGQQSQAERWMEDYVASGEADTEFKDFDWQRALERAKEDLPSRQDPTYEFSSDNPFTDSADAFQDGVKLFHEGKIKEAILAFEATVAKQADHADAWAYLGEAQAQSEKEQNAIAAFLQCLSIDPYNLKALLQLGVSYTNDLEDHRALNYLKAWMQNNPDYAGVAGMAEQNKEINQYMQFYGSENADSLYTYDNTLHGEVTKMFLNALSVRPDDPDLHTVLGVLYHISSDFDKSIEAFKNAVKLKPDDPALWNKLGATQANSSRSADAVHAYKRALQLRPTFVRALSNLAISYANQGLHEDAVRTYLTTLTHNPDANHVWSYLRISLSNLGRDELVELSQQRNVELFRPFFQF